MARSAPRSAARAHSCPCRRRWRTRCTTPSACASTRCRSRRRRCSRRCVARTRAKSPALDPLASRKSPGPSRPACPRPGRAVMEPRLDSRSVGRSDGMLRLPSFRYLQPTTLSEALRMKSDAGPEGTYVAGGTDLYPNMKRRQQEPKTVISLMGVPELKATKRRNDGTVGTVLSAGLTLSELSVLPSFRRRYPAVVQAAALVSTPLLRNMGTLGGNLCLDTRCNYYDQTYEWRKAIDFCMKKDGHICWVAPSSPRCWAVTSSDLAPVMVALGAEYLLAGPAGERVVPAARFYNNDGINYLTKQPDEVLVEVRLPAPAPAPGEWDAVYHKLRRRGSFDFPVLGVAAWMRWERDTVADARIVLGGVSSYPQKDADGGAALHGKPPSIDTITAAAEAAYRPAKPMDNTDFDLSWRKQMTRVYVARALEELVRRRSTTK